MSEQTRTCQIAVDVFRGALVQVLAETFERAEGLFLDPDTSLFETLATISATEASRPTSARCASVAAHVNHVRCVVDGLNQAAETGQPAQLDWPATWQQSSVSDQEWRDLIADLRTAYQELRGFASSLEVWPPPFVAGAFGIVAHCAYHLGEIRQALCVLKA